MKKRTYHYPNPTGICRPFRVTAVVTSGDYFCLVTVNWTGRSIQLVPTACMMLELPEEVNWSIFEHLTDIFCIELKIPNIIIRRGPYKGPHTASPRAVQVEAILESIPELGTERVTSAEVTGWLNRKPWLLPLPQSDLNARARKVQQRCIETAAYAAARVLQRRAALFAEEKGHFPYAGQPCDGSQPGLPA
ncbi:hypothetical protein [Tsuneonella sp. HG222]